MRRAPADPPRRPAARRGRLGAAALVVAAALASRAGAQDPAERATATAARVVVTAALSAASPLLVDGNGTHVREGIGAALGVTLAPDGWRVGPLRGELTARLAATPLRLRDEGERWSGGTASHVDLAAGASWSAERLTLSGGAGISWLRAGRVHAIGARLRPLLEATARVALTDRWGAAVTAQGTRLQPTDGVAGTVGRAMIGVTRAF